MVWYDMLTYVEKALADAGLGRVKYGALDPRTQGVDKDGILFLIRGQEADDGDNDLIENVKVTFYLECWVRDDDPDFKHAYQLLAEKEAKVDEVLASIKREAGMIGEQEQLMDLVVEQKTGDMGTLRPLCGVQYTVTATIYVSHFEE